MDGTDGFTVVGRKTSSNQEDSDNENNNSEEHNSSDNEDKKTRAKTANYKFRLEFPTEKGQKATMITNVIKSLVEKMTTTNSAKIFEIKHITSPNKKDNIKWEQIPRTKAQLKNYFMWQLNKLANQQTIITIIFTVVTDAKQHTIINEEVMEYTKNEHLRLALHQFETANLKEIGFIRDLNINLTYRPSWVSTVLTECTVPAKLPYFKIIPRKL